MDPKSNKENSSDIVDREEADFVAPDSRKTSSRKYEVVYPTVVVVVIMHLGAIYGLYLMVTQARWQTIIFVYMYNTLGGMGITAGVHRLWAHRAYKAKLPLQILLMLLNTIHYQYTAITWVRNHRLHHRHTDTDADPHNATRGLFFSHIGWLMVRTHPEVKKQGKFTDMSDIYSNPVLVFQKKYILPLVLVFGVFIPVAIPMYFWGESLNAAWYINVLRYMLSLHFAFSVNSLAHAWGYKPYDSTILSTQNTFVSLLTNGEGFHNYHHVFPWDYRTSEMGNNMLNLTTLFIDFFAWIGWAYDLKTVPDDMIRARANQTGDGKDLWGDNSQIMKKYQLKT